MASFDRKAYKAAYYAAHADELKNYAKAYYAVHADEIKVKTRDRNSPDPDKKKAASARYYVRHAEQIKAKAKAYKLSKSIGQGGCHG